ncbi:MAG: hypothetical protein U0235_29140 [Polyangiaceae bacterium]
MTARRALRGALPPLVALIAGALFYLLIRRDEVWFVSRILESHGALSAEVARLRSWTSSSSRGWPSLALGVTPDALWAFAVGGVVIVLAPPGRARLGWLVAGAVLVVGYELGQRLGLVPGTFDGADVIAQLVCYPLGAYVSMRARRVPVAAARTRPVAYPGARATSTCPVQLRSVERHLRG